MGIDPKKLQAFTQGGQPPDDGGDEGVEHEDVGGGEGAKKKKQHEAEEAEEGGEGKFGQLLPLLEAHAEDIADAIEGINPEILEDVESELEEEDSEALMDSADSLDQQLRSIMKKVFSGGLSPDEAYELADHLESEGLVDNAELVAGWFQRIAHLL
jgi:hypothetical protein